MTCNSDPKEGSVRHENLNESDSFITYPTNRLVCVIDKESDIDSLIRELNEHGYVADDVRILFSEEGARRLDRFGANHGWLAKLYRMMETAALESKTLHEFYAELMNGHFVFMIQTRDRDEGARCGRFCKSMTRAVPRFTDAGWSSKSRNRSGSTQRSGLCRRLSKRLGLKPES
jgi:hypothetical protein